MIKYENQKSNICKIDIKEAIIMNIDTLKVIIAIVRTGTISGAASQLDYAQSNISTKVQQLEESLQTKIFYRTNRGVILTTAGKVFYKRAVQIVNLTNGTLELLKNPGVIEGDMRIGALQPVSTTYLPPILTQYHRLFPKVRLTIDTGNTYENIEKVLNYELSGAVVGGEINNSELNAIPLIDEELCLITSKSQMPDLKTVPLLVFPTGCVYRKTLETWLSSRKVKIQQPIEFNYLNAILASVVAGLGISVVPKSVAKPFVQNQSMTAIDLPKRFAKVPLSFIYRKDHVIDRPFDEFTKVLVEDARSVNTES